MTKRHKRLFLIIGIFTFLIIAVLIVYAYFTSVESKENDITVANNTVEISERFEPPTEQTTGDNVFKKEVKVTNTDSSPCYVRVYADFSDSFVRSRSYLSDDEYLETALFYSASRIIDSSDGITTFPEYKNAGNDWYFIPESEGTVLSGYYYYKRPLNTGESTSPLFTFVKTVNQTEDDIDQYDILVYSESTQLSDINGNMYEDYKAAWTAFLT